MCHETQFELQVVSALNGDLCLRLMARLQWPVYRLKTEIANLEGTPVANQHLLLGTKTLADHEVVGDVLAGECAPYAMSFVRVGAQCEEAPPRDLALATHDGTTCVHWTVDGRKLQKNDRLAVSQPFCLDVWGGSRRVDFKMLIHPVCAPSFRKAAGKGRIELKCFNAVPEEMADLSFCVSVGNGKKFEAPRGPFSHDFAANGVGRLPKGEDEFDLRAAVDPESATFVVRLEVSCRCSHAQSLH